MQKIYSTQDRSLASLVKAMNAGRHRYLLIHGVVDSLILLAIVVGMPIVYGESLSLSYVILAVVLLTTASFLVVIWEWKRKVREATRLGIVGLDRQSETAAESGENGATRMEGEE